MSKAANSRQVMAAATGPCSVVHSRDGKDVGGEEGWPREKQEKRIDDRSSCFRVYRGLPTTAQ